VGQHTPVLGVFGNWGYLCFVIYPYSLSVTDSSVREIFGATYET